MIRDLGFSEQGIPGKVRGNDPEQASSLPGYERLEQGLVVERMGCLVLGDFVGPIRRLGPCVGLFILMGEFLPLCIFVPLGVRQFLLEIICHSWKATVSGRERIL